jgi:8-oxo-dGTP pyrophosphatase MutT (NUDIX family)
MTYIDHVSLLNIKNKRILLCKSKDKNMWQLPGGKRELGESDEQTLVRECAEELGVSIDSKTVKYLETIIGDAFGKDGNTKIKILIFEAEFNGTPVANSEIEDVGYFKLNEIPDTSELGWRYLQRLKDDGLID